MSVDARSLVGFLPEPEGTTYFDRYVIPDGTKTSKERWVEAGQELAKVPPSPNAGVPAVQQLPNSAANYVSQVQQNARFATTVNGMPFEFVLIEPSALLAIQFHVVVPHAQSKTAAIQNAPTLNEMLPICLPHTVAPPKWTVHLTADETKGSLVLASDDLNNRLLGLDQWNDQSRVLTMFGPLMGQGSPLVHVAEFGGRFFLLNGYHRVFGLMARGATAIPCLLLRTGGDATKLPIGSGYFDLNMLMGGNPPTIGHFGPSNGAIDLQLREVSRQVTISWAQFEIFETP